MAERSNGYAKTALARLKRVQGFVLDMDGTLVLVDSNNAGLRALPGAVDFVQHLQKHHIPYVSFTNGTVRPPQGYVHKLADVGISIQPEAVLTPTSVAAEYLAQKGFRRVMALGGEGVSEPLVRAGLEVVRPPQHDVQAIFVGWFRDFTMADIEAACEAIWGGAKLYSASLAPFFAGSEGRVLGTSCAIVGAIRQITGARAKLLGKPAPEALRVASQRLGISPENLAVVGDDPALEIAMAHGGKALAVGVTTGVGRREDFAAVPKGARAHLVLRDMGELLELYR